MTKPTSLAPKNLMPPKNLMFSVVASLVVVATGCGDDDASSSSASGSGGMAATGSGGAGTGGTTATTGGAGGQGRVSLGRIEVRTSDSYIADADGRGLSDIAATADAVFLTRGHPDGTLAHVFWRTDGNGSTAFAPVPAPSFGPDGFGGGFDLFGGQLHIGVRKQGEVGQTARYDFDGTYLGNVETNQSSNLAGAAIELFALGGPYIRAGNGGADFMLIQNDSWTVGWSVDNSQFLNGAAQYFSLNRDEGWLFRTGSSSDAIKGRIAGTEYSATSIVNNWAADVDFGLPMGTELFGSDSNAGFIDAVGIGRPGFDDVMAGVPPFVCVFTRYTVDGDPVQTHLLVDFVDDLQAPHSCVDVVTGADGRRHVIGWMNDDDTMVDTPMGTTWVPFVVTLDPTGAPVFFERLPQAAFDQPSVPRGGGDLRIVLAANGELVAVASRGSTVVVHRWPVGLF